jgi:hypothetical protein
MFHQNPILVESSKAESKRVLQMSMEVELRNYLYFSQTTIILRSSRELPEKGHQSEWKHEGVSDRG